MENTHIEEGGYFRIMGGIIERKQRLIFSFILILFCGGSLYAKTMTALEAEQAAKGWLKINSDPVYIGPNYRVSGIEAIPDISGEPLYYVVSLQPSGFVIVSANDLIEPIIGFSDEGIYSAATDNPMAALVSQDIPERLDASKQVNEFQLMDVNIQDSEHQNKWDHLIALGQAAENGFELMALDSVLVADIRVPPLIKSKWSQTTCCPSKSLTCLI